MKNENKVGVKKDNFTSQPLFKTIKNPSNIVRSVIINNDGSDILKNTPRGLMEIMRIRKIIKATETKNKPIQTLVERYIQLQAVKYVDEIVCYQSEKDLEDILEIFPIDIRFLGEEYKDKDFTGREICKKRGIQIYFNKRDHRFSSSELRKRLSESG